MQQVAAGSPAALLGPRPGIWRATIGGEQLVVGGDIILEVADIAVAPDGASLDQVQAALRRLRPGDSITARVLRGGKVVPLSAARPP